MRITIHLKDIPKIKENNKSKLINTVTHIVKNAEEGLSKLAEYNESKVSKHYFSNC